MKESKRRGEQAIEAFQEAARIDAKPRIGFGADIFLKEDAAVARRQGNDLLQPPENLVHACGEVVSRPSPSDFSDPTLEIIANTLDRPSSVSVGAAEDRLRAANAAGILEPALDTSNSARASNAIEKMLCHQMAAAHFSAMRLLERSGNERMAVEDAARCVNAAARMMGVYQTACVALQRLKTNGRQHVVVQYQQVNIGEGGQAVVAGRVGGSPARRKRGRMNHDR